jgi:hypothetical protein
MRHVASHREEAADKGRRGRQAVEDEHGMDRAVEFVRKRFEAIQRERSIVAERVGRVRIDLSPTAEAPASHSFSPVRAVARPIIRRIRQRHDELHEAGSSSMKPVKVLATVATGLHCDYLAATRPALEEYARKYDYELVVPEEDPAPERKNKQWSKIALIRTLLPDCDALVWIDSDAVIVDSSVDILSALSPRKSLGIVEHHYDGQLVPNTGVIVVRSGRIARQFFDEMWNMTKYLEHGWGDNAATLEMLGYRFDREAIPMVCQPERRTRWRRRVQFLDREWNSIPQDMSPHPHIVHITSSFSHQERLDRLQSAADSYH